MVVTATLPASAPAPTPTVAALDTALDALLVENLAGLDDTELAAELLALHRRTARLAAVIADRTAAFDIRQAATSCGDASTVGWLRSAVRLSDGQARTELTVARALTDLLPATRAALAAGQISIAHTQALSRVASTATKCGALPAAERGWLALSGELDPVTFAHALRAWVHTLTGTEAKTDQQLRDERYFALRPTDDGAYSLRGRLDPENGALLSQVIATLSRPTSIDARSPGQRRADALTELAERALRAGWLPRAHGHRPHLAVTIDWHHLIHPDGCTSGPGGGWPGEGGPAGSGPDHTGAHCNDPMAYLRPAATLTGHGSISLHLVRRLACDASVARVLLDADGEILDYGRSTYTVPAGLRRAVHHRDQGCAWPGCDRPPWLTDIHHLHHWADGGPTSLANCVALCRTHHTYTHEHRWQLHRHDGHWTIRPPSPD